MPRRTGTIARPAGPTPADPAADLAGSVRPGEALDVSAVDTWLKRRVKDLRGAPRVTQYTGGASNWTYRLAYPGRDLILRRPPTGTKARSAHDMGREYRVQKALAPVYPFVPEMIAYCDDESVVGAPFYVMRRLDGTIPRREFPAGLALDRDQARRLCTRVVDTLVALHLVDHRAAGLDRLGRGAGYARRQIEGWSERSRRVHTWNVGRGHDVMAWLAGHLPAVERLAVTHNDFRLDNLVLDRADPTRVVGVLDWEMATIGDPLMDLGNALAYWVQADDDVVFRRFRRQPTHLPGMMTRREVRDHYCERMGFVPDDWAFYEVYGLFRLAVIAQQIYYRYHHRQTRNPAFRHFWLVANYLLFRCRHVMRRAVA